MTDRETLIALCEDVILSCKASLCDDCEHNIIDYPHCMGVHFATHLISNGVTVQRWIPVTERLPEEGQEIITCTLHRWGDRTVGVKIFWSERQYGWGDVTHWMPLPEPPKEGE